MKISKAIHNLGDRIQFAYEGKIATATVVSVECVSSYDPEDFKNGYPCPGSENPVLYGVCDRSIEGTLLLWEHETASVPMDAIALLSLATA